MNTEARKTYGEGPIRVLLGAEAFDYLSTEPDQRDPDHEEAGLQMDFFVLRPGPGCLAGVWAVGGGDVYESDASGATGYNQRDRERGPLLPLPFTLAEFKTFERRARVFAGFLPPKVFTAKRLTKHIEQLGQSNDVSEREAAELLLAVAELWKADAPKSRDGKRGAVEKTVIINKTVNHFYGNAGGSGGVPPELGETDADCMALRAPELGAERGTTANPRPMPRQRCQEDAILAKLVELGHDPAALPKPLSGRACPIKTEVARSLGFTEAVMRKAWQRLRDEERIRNR